MFHLMHHGGPPPDDHLVWELEADEFSGFAVAKLGVRRSTLVFFRDIPGADEQRYAAAITGWKKGRLGLEYDDEWRAPIHEPLLVLSELHHATRNIGGLPSLTFGMVGMAFGSIALSKKRRLDRKKVFISYRRVDSAGYAGRIHDKLAAKINHKNIFMDVNKIDPGEDFNAKIAAEIAKCDVVLVVIGPQWLEVAGHDGRRRIDNPNDLVRREVESGLSARTVLIPILVGGASMPDVNELPSSMAGFTKLNALEIRHTHFDADAGRIVSAIAKSQRPRLPKRNGMAHQGQ